MYVLPYGQMSLWGVNILNLLPFQFSTNNYKDKENYNLILKFKYPVLEIKNIDLASANPLNHSSSSFTLLKFSSVNIKFSDWLEVFIVLFFKQFSGFKKTLL